jgi:hypothetical protein
MKRPHVPILHVEYDEPDPTSYRWVGVSFGSVSQTFGTGNPIADYAAALDYARTLVTPGEEERSEVTVFCSSSVDNFLMDGGRLTPERA